MICRDRAGAYADAGRQGAPQADQVADRWHIYHNLCEHVGKAAARHRACLEEPASGEPVQASVPDAPEVPDLQQAAIEAAARRAEESVLAIRTRQRYELVQSLKAQGKGIKPIKRETGLAKETVRRFYRAERAGELLAKVKDGRPSILDEHKPYLHHRWNEGCTNVIQLHAELKERGYKGSYGTVRDYVLPFRGAGAAPPAAPGPPKARDLARWILAVAEQVNGPAGVDVDEDRAVVPAAAEREVVDSHDRHGAGFGVGQGHDQAEHAGPPGRQVKFGGEPGPGPPGHGQRDRGQHPGQRWCPPRSRRGQALELLGERDRLAAGVAAEEPAHPEPEHHRVPADRRVGQPAQARRAPVTRTARTAGRPRRPCRSAPRFAARRPPAHRCPRRPRPGAAAASPG